VRSVRYVAPWNAKSTTTAIPANTVYALKRSKILPVQSPLESIGSPYRREERPIPQISDAPKLPMVLAHVQVARQRRVSLFERHSNDTTRMIRKKRMSRRAM